MADVVQDVVQDLIQLTGYTEKDAAVLRQYAAHTAPWEEAITQAFYDMLYGYGRTAAVFRDGERPAREQTLRHWYRVVSGGQIDDQFWRWQWFVGLIHIPRHVTNPFMLGAMSRVQQIFLSQCLATLPVDEAANLFTSFKRVTDVIAGLIAEGYFESYIRAMERMSGQSRTLIDRMVQMEVESMVEESRPAKK